MKEKGLVTVRIYDVSGRLVRTLFSGVKDAGRYSLAWNGANDRGAEVASGIYFYKMEANGFNLTRKMVMLR
jgi:flagellar hook assembly protein FlgD